MPAGRRCAGKILIGGGGPDAPPVSADPLARGGMTGLAVVLEACRELGIVDPAAFFALPDTAQQLWTDHAANRFSGAYLTAPKRKAGSMSASKAAEVEARARREDRRRARGADR